LLDEAHGNDLADSTRRDEEETRRKVLAEIQALGVPVRIANKARIGSKPDEARRGARHIRAEPHAAAGRKTPRRTHGAAGLLGKTLAQGAHGRRGRARSDATSQVRAFADGIDPRSAATRCARRRCG
jgi:hypothetical protein